jgi:hypothetical protein
MCELHKIMNETDIASFKQYISNLKEGAVELAEPLILEQSYDDKTKRAEFHNFFKASIPEYITDTIIEEENRNAAGQSRKMQIYLRDGLSGRQRKKLNLTERQVKANVPQYLRVVI